MKKIFWTTIFRLIVVLGFVFYMRSFDADMANGIAARLGATNVVTQDTLATDDQPSVMSGIIAIQDTLTDMQATLDILVGTTTPTVDITPAVDTTPAIETVTPVNTITE